MGRKKYESGWNWDRDHQFYLHRCIPPDRDQSRILLFLQLLTGIFAGWCCLSGCQRVGGEYGRFCGARRDRMQLPLEHRRAERAEKTRGARLVPGESEEKKGK